MCDPGQHQSPPQSPAPAAGAHYDRRRDLPRLLPLTTRQITDDTLADDRRVIALLQAALYKQRRRGVAGTWDYDAARHRGLLSAYRCEVQRLRRPPQR